MATVDGKPVDMNERVWQQLLALPYSIESDEEGHLVLTPLQAPGLNWEELATTHPILPNDLAWKVETDIQNQIIMSPPSRDEHQDFGIEIILLLSRLLPDGRSYYEVGVQTSDGVKVPDVGWMSRSLGKTNRKRIVFPTAPEVCIEILSPGNSRRETEEKKRLYLEAGALEVWTCGRDGTTKFYDANGSLPASRLCPVFPARINIPD